MGLSVVAETATVEAYFSGLYGRTSGQVGLLIGAIGPKKVHVIHAAPTPILSEEEGGEGGVDKNKKQKQRRKAEKMDVCKTDAGFMAAHAEQVERALPGGLSIIGIYVFAPVSNDTAAAARRLLYAVDGAIRKIESFAQQTTQPRERLALQVCSATRKISCRSFDTVNSTAAARQASWAYQGSLDKWHCVKASVDMACLGAVPTSVVSGGGVVEMSAHAAAAFAPALRRFDSAVVVDAGGSVLAGEAVYETELPSSGTPTLSLYLPPSAAAAAAATTNSPSSGTSSSSSRSSSRSSSASFELRGSAALMAVAPPKSSRGAVAAALIHDAKRSFKARVAVACEGWMDEAAANEEDALSVAQAPTPMPVRVATVLAGRLHCCDYRFADETLEDCAARLGSLLALPRGARTTTTGGNKDDAVVVIQLEKFATAGSATVNNSKASAGAKVITGMTTTTTTTAQSKVVPMAVLAAGGATISSSSSGSSSSSSSNSDGGSGGGGGGFSVKTVALVAAPAAAALAALFAQLYLSSSGEE